MTTKLRDELEDLLKLYNTAIAEQWDIKKLTSNNLHRGVCHYLGCKDLDNGYATSFLQDEFQELFGWDGYHCEVPENLSILGYNKNLVTQLAIVPRMKLVKEMLDTMNYSSNNAGRYL
jgi:hypothetical protein